MVDIPQYPDSVYVSTIQTEYGRKIEFDSTYPIHLNGIISQHEFQQSISKINQAIPSSKICRMNLYISFILSLALMNYVSFIKLKSSFDTLYYVLAFFSIFSIFGLTFILMNLGSTLRTIYSKFIAGIRAAVAEESMKYSSRSSVPCSWRLDTPISWGGPFLYYFNCLPSYYIIIDIGRSVRQESSNQMQHSNQVDYQSVSLYEQQDNSAPAPQSNQSSEFCSQCNALRQDLAAKDCSSCGHTFNEH